MYSLALVIQSIYKFINFYQMPQVMCYRFNLAISL